MADFGIGVPDELARLSLGNGAEQQESRAPDMNSAGIVAVDITDRFSLAVRTLEPGELIKDEFFTLFESVGALEIMDPKMDSGCIQPGDEFEELYDVGQPLLPEEVLGIIDQLICHEMSWHLGYPLSQTLFTSVYVEALSMPNPVGIEQAIFVRDPKDKSNDQPMLQVLRAYCLGLLKACGYVNERVRAEHSYEEEDFVTNTYNRTLLANVSTDAVRTAITEARGLLERLRSEAGHSYRAEVIDALEVRLELRDIFLQATECPQYIKEPNLAQIPWQQGISLLPALKSTHHLCKPVDDSFSAKLQRKLASTIPPRPIVQLGFDDAFGNLTRLFQDGLEIIGVLHYTDTQCLQTCVSAFQSKKPQPLVYVRTLLQTFLFDAMEVLGSMSIRQLIDDDLSIITLPASPLLDRLNDEIEVVHDPRFIVSQQMEFFRQRAAQPFLDILRTLCQNRCRVRRTLCHTVRAWDNLQVDAEEVDQVVQAQIKESPLSHMFLNATQYADSLPLSLSSWAYFYKLRQMEWIIQLGFELEVYQGDELAGMYWYLNYLAKCRLRHLERIKSFTVSKAEEIRALQARENNHAGPQIRQLERSLSFIRLSLLDAAATWELSDALSCLYTVLARLGLVKPPGRPYSNDELRYELRMKPFASIGLPELPSFEDFTAGTKQQGTSTDDILEYCDRSLMGAKRAFETMTRLPPTESFSVGSHERWLDTAKNALKSCIAAGLAVKTIQATLRKGEKVDVKFKVEIPTPDKAYHDWWLVPKLITLP
ncbi:hypothetical protein V2G26_001062 [Clonostachys chloroleuca]